MNDFEPSNGEQIDQEEAILDWNVPDSNSPVSEECKEFWGDAREIEKIIITVRPPAAPLAILEKLGPSPFERGGFPLIGFLATTFDKVSQFALERAGYAPLGAATTTSTDSTES
jgi:hypothetical protein